MPGTPPLPQPPAAPAESHAAAARPRRADARRNREAVLRAAREAFEQDGVLTPLDGVAARAGVGNATLYRNFPTRDDLLAAVMQDSIAAAVMESGELARALAPRDALAEWLVRLAWRLRIWHDLPYCLSGASGAAPSPAQTACDPLVQQTAHLLNAAQEAAGAAPSGLNGAQEVYELVLALSWAVDRFGDDEDRARRRVARAAAAVLP